MAIRINQGTLPVPGRLTMPQGTFLSEAPPFDNPGTSAFGSLGGSAGMNVPSYGQIGNFPPGGTPSPLQQYNQPNFLSNFLQSIDQQMRNTPNALEMAQNFDFKIAEQRYGSAIAKNLQAYADIVRGVSETKTSPTGAFTPPKNSSNPLVGEDVGSSPNYITDRTIASIFGGGNAEQISESMRAKGYQRVYQAGVGGVWVKIQNNPNAPDFTGGVNERGRPNFVDPTSLEYGERVTAASGLTFVGGLPYTNPAGETVSQYAVTIPGGVSDEHFKWKSTVKKDEQGNWVNVYSRELRKVYTRSHWKRKQAREEAAAASKPQGNNYAEINQLVNLRADYG